MIVRTWRATATSEGADTYQHHFANVVIRHLRAIQGFSGASLLRRETGGSVELVALTLWQSLDSIRSFTGRDPDQAIVDADARTMLTSFETTAGNYNLVVEER
jgi:heme-degrading monooxygenase HmoA